MTQNEIFLEMRGISKTFDNVQANNNISLDVKSGEVHALLGENGAGKSTLMKILYGLYQADQGEIFVKGQKVNITSPHAAISHGIGMVHQNFMFVENLTALDNILLGLDEDNSPFLKKREARLRFKQLAKNYDLLINPDAPVWQLPVGQQQWLELLKLLFRNVQLLVLDEPTGVLAPSQVKSLFTTIRRLTEEGRSVIIISHKLDEVQEISDRITVLRDGGVVGTLLTNESTPSILAKMMVGRSVSLARRHRPVAECKSEALTIKDLWCKDERGISTIRGLNLSVKEGEIVCIAGVDGNGQRELANCISGLQKPSSGTIQIGGVQYKNAAISPSILGFVPEDRKLTGLIPSFSVAENLALKTFWKSPFARRGILDLKKIKDAALDLVALYKIKTPTVEMPVQTLSGGNQQKVVVARECKDHPLLLLCSQATRGLDLGAIEFLHELILTERNRGCGVLFISTELPEVLALCDRVMVLYKGECMGVLPGDGADVNVIGEMMLGRNLGNLEKVYSS